jgi:predicted DNA-binding transcriptional regulator AlpA
MTASDPTVRPNAERVAGTDSHALATKPSRKVAPFSEADLLQKLFWSVPETAFMARLGVRTVWRLMADPKSGFPRPRRIGRRTLLARDEVLALLAKEAAR